jgi:hypothetical protein
MRKSHLFFLTLGIGVSLLVLTLLHSQWAGQSEFDRLQQRSNLVKQLDLTDLTLFTEARYTRHLSQSDLHTGFQDHPLALEHFPSGSLLLPPTGLGHLNANPDP